MLPHASTLILLAALLHAVWNALLRGAEDRLWGATVMSFSVGVACFGTAFFVPLPLSASWPLILLSALLHIAYNLLLARMYRQGDFGHTYPIARGASPLLIALGGTLLASEHLHPITAAGIGLISCGILTLSLARNIHLNVVPAALATGLAIAAYSITDALGVRLAGNLLSYTAWIGIAWGLPMPLVYLLIRRDRGRTLLNASGPEFAKAIGGGLISIAGYLIIIWAMRDGAMGPVSALRETSILFAALLGRLFLGEPFTLRKAAAATLIVGGTVCLHLG